MENYVNAENLDLGDWNKVKEFARRYKRQILLRGKDYIPSKDRWDGILMEMPENEQVFFVCKAVNVLHPDEMSPHNYQGKPWLYLWWD